MAKKKEIGLVINQIIIKAPQRKTSDVGTWRAALQSADSGRVKALFDLYEDLLIDGVLSDAMQKRIDAVTNSELTYQDKSGKDVPEMTLLIDTPAMEELLTQIMHHRFWGRAGMEFDFTNGFEVHGIPKKHINLVNKQILLNEFDVTGIPYEGDDHLLILGKKNDFGLFLKTAPYAIWKRGGFGDYAQWLELFGMPQRVGKYSSYDAESRKLLEEALEKSGSAPWVVIPKDSEVETVNNTGAGSGSPYNDFRKACNEEILITLLGQTMTTVQGDKGARSLGEVHKEVEEGKNRSDLRFVQRVLNYYVLPMLQKRGFSIGDGGGFVFPKAAEALSVAEIVNLSDILDIPASFLHEKYAIPVPVDGEVLARRNQGTPPEAPPEPPDPGTKKDKKVKVEKIENADKTNFLKNLWDFFVKAPAQMGALGNHLTLSDTNFNDRIIAKIDGSVTFSPELFQYFGDEFIKALDGKEPLQLADLGFAYNYLNDAFRTAQELNIFHFSAAKTLAEIAELNRLYNESSSFEEFYKKAVQTTDVFNKKWQKTEYQTATLIAESAANYNRLIKKTKLFPYWKYLTVGDDKVREEHAALHGVILAANDPRWKNIFPPNGWKCRCYVVGVMAHETEGIDLKEMQSRVDAFYETDEFSKSKAQGFGINRALLPQVFTANQMYLNKFPTRAGKLLKSINYQTYGLGSMQQNRAKATQELIPYKGTAAEYFKGLKTEDGKLFFTDYNQRSVLFDETKYLKGHTLVKYAERTNYIEAAGETLKNPDEVWINATQDKLSQFVFVKYYKNQSVIVITEIKEGKVYRVITWFPVTENKATKGYRSGLLIKKRL